MLPVLLHITVQYTGNTGCNFPHHITMDFNYGTSQAQRLRSAWHAGVRAAILTTEPRSTTDTSTRVPVLQYHLLYPWRHGHGRRHCYLHRQSLVVVIYHLSSVICLSSVSIQARKREPVGSDRSTDACHKSRCHKHEECSDE